MDEYLNGVALEIQERISNYNSHIMGVRLLAEYVSRASVLELPYILKEI
jgi:hypothetical protein